MSGALVLPKAPAQVLVVSRKGTSFVSRAHSGKTQRRSRGGQTWLLRYAWENLERADYSDLLAFLIDQDGQYETFTTTMPVHADGRGSWAGTPLVNGASQTGHSLAADGFTPSASNVIRELDFFKFTGHAKVYCATADQNANGSGEVTIAFRPDLVTSPADNEAITSSSVPMTVSLATDLLSLPLRPPVLGALEVDFEEVW